ncbi:hypothetical protein HDU93_007153 [Gonapodya sp. JEL0774]|nr:hypothetical protein HDU93_007153 [Gonapodya sp. JEL0774]
MGQGAGPLGLGADVTESRSPGLLTLPLQDPVITARAGIDRAYAVTKSGRLFGWGRNGNGSLGVDRGGRDSGVGSDIVWEPKEMAMPGGLRWEDVAVGADWVIGVAIDE